MGLETISIRISLTGYSVLHEESSTYVSTHSNSKCWCSWLSVKFYETASSDSVSLSWGPGSLHFLMDSQGQRYNEGYECWETVQWYKLKSNTKHSNLPFKATYRVKATLQMSSPLCVACHHTRFIWSDSQLISESKVKSTLREVQCNEWWLAERMVKIGTSSCLPK